MGIDATIYIATYMGSLDQSILQSAIKAVILKKWYPRKTKVKNRVRVYFV